MGTANKLTAGVESLHEGADASREVVYRTVADQAYAMLRRRILDGDLHPGSRIDQDSEGKRLSASRMPIREALRRLESEGLVEIERHRGVFVTPLRVESLEDLYVLRIALEGIAARLGAERVDDATLEQMRGLLPRMDAIVERGDRDEWLKADGAFHMLLYAAAQQPRLLATIRGLRDEAGRYRVIGLSRQPHELELGQQDHYAIVEACARRDGAQAERTIQQTLDRWRQMLREFLVSQ